MKIAIIGYGHIGGTLGKKWVAAGHTVQYGVRDPQKEEVAQLVRSLGKDASATDIGAAIRAGDAVVFAIPGNAMADTVKQQAQALPGKLVIDTTNNVSQPVANSLAAFQSVVPSTRYYRAFNNYGWEVFENPIYDGVAADQFFCGPDGDGKTVVEGLIREVGLNPVYLGGPDQIGVVDGVLRLWITLVRGGQMPRTSAFKMLSRR